MKIMILCGVFAKENQQEVMEHAKRPVEYSANIFQEKLISGFRNGSWDVQVLSAPFIGSYPNASTLADFRGFSQAQDTYTYVSFNNIWGVRNFSRAHSLKKALREFIAQKDDEKLIVVYSPHTPFLEAAVYAKARDPRIKICMVVPDLPQYMNLDEKISMIYKLGKQWDIATLNRLNRSVDSYMLLTEPMKEKLDVGHKPYIVVEGIVNEAELAPRAVPEDAQDAERYIVYTGKMNERFGVKDLVDAFVQLPDESYRLVLCGTGDAQAYIQEKASQDGRIRYMGQVTPQEAGHWMQKAAVLVNPRKNNEVYTRYSFPSKNVEYLLSGRPVVAYELDGIPACYREFFYYVQDDSAAALQDAICRALSADKAEQNAKYEAAQRYFRSHLTAPRIAQKIWNMTACSEIGTVK